MIVVGGLALLQRVDGVLEREYAREAAVQAAQAQALIESFIARRVGLLTTLQSLVATARDARERQSRFGVFGRAVVGSEPDISSIYLLDADGGVRDAVRRQESGEPRRPGEHLRLPTGPWRSAWGGAVAGTVRLPDGGRGLVAYVPLRSDDRVVGFVAGTLAYQSLFDEALAGQLRGHFAYRIADETGTVIARSADFPERVGRVVVRDAALPGGARWQLEVAVPRFQPLVPRAANWLIGTLVLSLLVVLVLREEARVARIAAHSEHLEGISRRLLDANLRAEERARQLDDANRAKSRFLANVSHELRTPLNAIVGYNALVIDGVYGPLDVGHRVAHERIHAAAEHLLALVDDVLDLAKIEVGRMEVSIEPVDLGALIESVATVVEPIAEAKGVRLDVVVGPGVMRVMSDPRHLRQILLNLASNAVKFTDRGSVSIVARRGEDDAVEAARITVQDTGSGIGAADLARIFEEFEQVRPAGRGDSMQRGVGLGLTLGRRLARLLGGDVQVESRIGEGSRFTLILPRREGPADSPALGMPRAIATSSASVSEPAATGLDSNFTAG
ncbi:MAG: hypothetical protein NVS1B4_26740 [Gemmatimonadaceae bacterium]